MRRVIQITAGDPRDTRAVLYALGDDGSLWRVSRVVSTPTGMVSHRWHRIEDVPQDDGRLSEPRSFRVADVERLRILTAILLRHPRLLSDVGNVYRQLDLPRPLAALRTAILEWADVAETLDAEGLIGHLSASGLQAEADTALLATATVPAPLPASATPAEAAAGWWHIYEALPPGERITPATS